MRSRTLKKKGVFLLSCILSLTSLLARNARAAEIDGTQLQKLLKFYAPIQELEVGFHQTKHLKEMDLNLKSEGQLHVTRPDQVTWRILKPSPLQLDINRDRIQITTGEGDKKTVQSFGKGRAGGNSASQALAMITPWLTLDEPMLTAHYQVHQVEPHHFQFVPKEKKLFSQVEVRLGDDGHMESLLLSELSGDTMSIQFEKPRVLRSQP